MARFSFDGQAYAGVEGDTLASALLANGVHLVGRSFKYHRPRGFLSAGAEEPNALVQIARDDARKTPNVRATVQELYDGLAAQSQNRWPSLAFDVGAVNDIASPFFSAGFYYKTFMWPKAAWKSLYEPKIRAAAGLGVSPDQPDPDHYAARFAHCDVLVLGGGAAGIAAALASAETGASVMLADEQAEFGGSLRFETGARIDGQDGFAWAQGCDRQAKGHVQCPRALAHDGVRLLRAEFRRAGRARQRPSAKPGSRPGARAAVAGPRQARRAGDRRHRAPHGVCRQ